MHKLLAPALALLLAAVAFAPVHAQEQDTDITIAQALSEDEDFSTLVSLLERTGLAETLAGAGPFTVFAPSNGAFEELDASVAELLQDDAALLEQILLGHVIEGAYNVNDLQDAEDGSIVSLQGDPLTFDLSVGGLDVNNVELNSFNVENSYANGIVHGVGDVIIPVSLAGTLGADATDTAESVSDGDDSGGESETATEGGGEDEDAGGSD